MIQKRFEKKTGSFPATLGVQLLLVSKIILYSILLLAASAFAENLKVTDAEISHLESLLKKNSVVTDQKQIQSLEALFRSRSTAHRLRLSQVYLEMVKDPQFIKEFPEFSPLVNKSKKTVQALLEHDASKGSEETAKAIRVLSLTQGIDYRNPPKGLTAEDQKLLSKTMKNAIDDLNTMDDRFMADALKKISPNGNWTKAHESLTETIDFYDTYKSRQAEIAKDGKPLASPSQWIEKLEADGFYSAEEKKANVLKKRFALYLEKKDPLARSNAYAQAEDFSHLAESKALSKDIDVAFLEKGKLLLKQASKIQTGQVLNRFLGYGKTVPLNAAVMLGLGYVVSPEAFNANDEIGNLVMSTSTSNCDTIKCHQFFAECARLINIKLSSANVMIGEKDFPKCLDRFFNLPLSEQAQLRQDSNLDQILLAYAPAIRNLTCSKDGTEARIETVESGKKTYTHKMIFSGTSTPSQVISENLDAKTVDRLVFQNSKAQVFQHCKDSSTCKNYEIKDLLEIKLGIWRSENLPRIVSGPMQQINVHSFTWARKGHQLATREASSIKSCCHDQQCQTFFSDRVTNFNQAVQRQIAAKTSK